MKYLVLLYDGMADYPVPALNGKTPMEVAKKPLFDRLASKGEVGMVRTVAEGLKPALWVMTRQNTTPGVLRLRRSA